MSDGLDVDHVMILSETPKEDMAAFARAADLPDAWEFMDFGAIKSGGVWAGKTAIEFAYLEGAKNSPTRLAGLALSSDMAPWPLTDALRDQRLKHVPPTHVMPADDTPMSWTNTLVGGLLTGEPKTIWLSRFGGDRTFTRWLSGRVEKMVGTQKGLRQLNTVIKDQLVFFVHYHPPEIAQEQRSEAQKDFENRHGATDVSVKLELSVARKHRAAWSRLIGIKLSEQSIWQSPSGVALSFNDADTSRLDRVTIAGLAVQPDALPAALQAVIQFT